MISFLLSICMIITMIPLKHSHLAWQVHLIFTYDTPEDITIYKNETEVVILMDYGYTYENGNDYKKCNLETISASSNNRNIEIRQPEQSEKESGWKMKVKGLSEGTSTVTLQYSWKYNGVRKQEQVLLRLQSEHISIVGSWMEIMIILKMSMIQIPVIYI